MDINIYYNSQEQELLVTSNFSEIQRWMDLGINPKINYEQISLSNLGEFNFSNVAFDRIDNIYLQSIKNIFSYKFETIAFHDSIVDLSDIVLNVKHLIVGNNIKFNLAKKNFKNLDEITFLSVKNFKGRILDKIDSVIKLTLWYENKKSNSGLSMFPNLTELIINNGTIEVLDLTLNPLLERLQLHNCTKMESVSLKSDNNLKEVIIERCGKLNTNNLEKNVKNVRNFN